MKKISAKKFSVKRISCQRDVWMNREKQSSPGLIVHHPANQIMTNWSSDTDPRRLKWSTVEEEKDEEEDWISWRQLPAGTTLRWVVICRVFIRFSNTYLTRPLITGYIIYCHTCQAEKSCANPQVRQQSHAGAWAQPPQTPLIANEPPVCPVTSEDPGSSAP